MIKFYSQLCAIFVLTGCITIQIDNESAAVKDGGSISEVSEQQEEIAPTVDAKADISGV